MKCIALFLILYVHPAAPQSLTKSFAYLNAGQYDLASTSFREILKKDYGNNPAAQFGLARLYFMKDYKFYNLDSANSNLLKCEQGLSKEWSKSDKKKFLDVGYREYNVKELQSKINAEAYRVADSINESAAWNHFLATFTTSSKITEATEKRNQAAFNEALQKNDYSSFEDFVKKYPAAKQVNAARTLYEDHLYKSKTKDSTWQSYKRFYEQYPKSPYSAKAKTNYERLLYIEKTKSHLPNDYQNFILNFPESPYAQEAEDSIYTIVTRKKQISDYLSFISTYPVNHNVSNAWQQIYEKETPNYSSRTFRNFLSKYPNYPNADQVQKDLRLSGRQLESFRKKNLWGFIDSKSRDTVIRAQFTEAAPFQEGMAVVKLPCNKQDCPYAYVGMDGKIMNKYPWSDASDFNEGRAIAALGNCKKDSCRYGFINRFGDWIVPPLYDEVYDFAEGLSLVKKEKEGYGYVDAEGKVVIPLKFADASSFSEGVASVMSKDSMRWGFIDKAGRWVIFADYMKAGSFREGLAPAADERNLWGYIDHSGNWVIKPQYEFALPFINGRAKVEVKQKDRKNPHLTLITDKVIDKKGKYLAP